MTRVFIGRLPHEIEEKQIHDFFRDFRSISNVTLKQGYGFVDFEDSRDADEAVHTMHNQVLGHDRITVEFARDKRDRDDRRDRYDDRRDRYDDRRDRYDDRRDRYDDRRDRYDDRRGDRYDRYDDRRDRYDDRRDRYDDRRDRYDDRRDRDYERRPRSAIKRGYRLNVTNLATDVSWQDLKDFFGKEHGYEVNFADAHKRVRGEGIIEFMRYEDMKKALSSLSGADLRGSTIELQEDEFHNRGMFEKNGETYPPADSATDSADVTMGNGRESSRSPRRSPRRSPVRDDKSPRREWDGDRDRDEAGH